MNAQTIPLFPNPILVMDFQGPELAMITEEIEGAMPKINMVVDGSRHMVKTSYGVAINDILEHGLFQLKQSIDEAVIKYTQDVTGEMQPMKICESWFNEYRQGGYMSEHEHPGNTVSGVYYHKADEESGNLWFRNPNTLMLNGHWPGTLVEHYKNVPVQAKKGRLVLFPSWMPHSVSTVKSANSKISISFNLQ
jgi:uncharacterized protein (TIGR02466 family)